MSEKHKNSYDNILESPFKENFRKSFELAINAYRSGLRIKPITGEEDEKWYHIDDVEPLRLIKRIYLCDIWEIENMIKWIKFSEYAPMQGQKVLVCGLKEKNIQIAIYKKGKFQTDDFCKSSFIEYVTHWTLLPEFPKDD